MRTRWHVVIWLVLLAIFATQNSNEPPQRSSGNWNRAPLFEEASQIPGLAIYPTEVGPGQLLFSETRLSDGILRYSVLDPESSKQPATFLESSTHHSVEARIDSDVLLVRGPKGLFLLRLSDGATIPLGLGKFYGQSENVLSFYLYSKTPKGEPWGPKYLHQLEPNSSAPIRVSQRELHEVLAESEVYFVMEGEEGLWLVDKAKNRRERMLIKTTLRKKIPGLKFSPDGKQIAYSENDGGKWSLVVLTTVDGREVGRVDDLSVDVSSLSSFGGMLAFDWLDDQRIRYSNSERTSELDPEFHTCISNRTEGFCLIRQGYFRWVDFDLESGRIEPKERYSRMGGRHRSPFQEGLTEHSSVSSDGNWELVENGPYPALLLRERNTGTIWKLPEGSTRYSWSKLSVIGIGFPRGWKPKSSGSSCQVLLKRPDDTN